MPEPINRTMWTLSVVGALVLSAVVITLLQVMPARFRRPLILTLTFVGGLYFALEFFWPVHPMPTKADPDAVGNFLTPGIVPFGNFNAAVAGFTVGLGVIN